jgi:predicted secreted protein
MLRLAAGAVIMTIVWCCVLPRVLELAPVREHVALMEERGVDPSAMYYTELERLPLRSAWLDAVIVIWP